MDSLPVDPTPPSSPTILPIPSPPPHVDLLAPLSPNFDHCPITDPGTTKCLHKRDSIYACTCPLKWCLLVYRHRDQAESVSEQVPFCCLRNYCLICVDSHLLIIIVLRSFYSVINTNLPHPPEKSFSVLAYQIKHISHLFSLVFPDAR